MKGHVLSEDGLKPDESKVEAIGDKPSKAKKDTERYSDSTIAGEYSSPICLTIQSWH